MTISGMGNASTPLENSDVLPIVRNSTNLKTTLTNIATYVFNTIGSFFNGGNGISYANVNDENVSFPVSNSGVTSTMRLDHVRAYIIKYLFSNYIDAGTINTESDSAVSTPYYQGTVVFTNELKNTPRVVMTMHSNDTDSGLYTLKVSNASTTGFTWTVTKFLNGSVVPNDRKFNISYIAIYEPSTY